MSPARHSNRPQARDTVFQRFLFVHCRVVGLPGDLVS